MISSDKNLTVLFNGEIYNYQKIKELISIDYQYNTNSDTEVILAAYKQWGIRCFDYFEGMFAITLIDHAKNKIFIARDLAGVKPLYYFFDGINLFLTSEYKVLMNSNILDNEINHDSLKKYIIFQTVPDRNNLIKGIKKLMPGEILGFDMTSCKTILEDKIKLKNYDNFKNYDEYVECLKNEIYFQMNLATNTDLPTGYHLSGGIDSNTLVSLTQKLRSDQNFFFVTSIIDDEIDNESDYIFEAAKNYGRELKVVHVNAKNFFEVLDNALYQLDEPVGDPGLIPQYLVNKEISQYAKIVYSGQGFDELFFGYARNLAAYSIAKFGKNSFSLKNSSLPEEITNFFSEWHDFKKELNSLSNLSPEMTNYIKLCRFNPYLNYSELNDKFLTSLKEIAENEFSNLNQRSMSLSEFIYNSETTIQLPSLLHMEDRVSMIHSVETRVPFCTNSIISLAYNKKLEWIFRNHKTKGVIKDIVQNLIPSNIANRPNKVGRPVPFRKWFKERNDLVSELNDKKEQIEFLYGTKNIVNYALNNENPFDRTLWGIWSLTRWIEKYNISI